VSTGLLLVVFFIRSVCDVCDARSPPEQKAPGAASDRDPAEVAGG
jgi:hypothetical protein